MSSYKLQKIKEYLKENLKKKFITFSKTSFASSILLIEKKDNSLCFCIVRIMFKASHKNTDK